MMLLQSVRPGNWYQIINTLLTINTWKYNIWMKSLTQYSNNTDKKIPESVCRPAGLQTATKIWVAHVRSVNLLVCFFFFNAGTWKGRTMAKQTLDAYFLPDEPSSVPESNPNSEDESESEDTSVAGERGQKMLFFKKNSCKNLTC